MNNYDYKKLCPFKWYVLENFPFIEEDFDALTNWQLFCKLGKEINKIIKNVNASGEQVEQLTRTVIDLQNYLENLDVQEEINNKLDEMAESGELTDIIAQYLNLQGILAYNTVNDMANAENLANGSFARTYGKLEYNDGEGAFYKIREILNTDVIDGYDIVAITNDNTLVAEKMPDKAINDLFTMLNNLPDYMYTDFSLEHKYDTTSHTHYHVLTIPHGITAKLGVANDNITTYGDAERTIDFSTRKQSELVINAGIFSSSNIPEGFLIQDGEIIKADATLRTDTEYLTIDSNGVLDTAPYNASPETLVANGIKTAVMGWWAIVRNGQFVSHDSSVVGGTSIAPRQVIGQDENNNIYIFTCEGRTRTDYGMTIEDVANILITDYNCVFAYNLDGGGSTSTVLYNNKVNYDIDSLTDDRGVPTFLYFKKDAGNADLKNNLFAQNGYSGEIQDFFHDMLIPKVLQSGNFKYYVTELADCNELNINTGFYYVKNTTPNAPGDTAYLLFHYTWNSDIINDANLRQICIPLQDGFDIVYRIKYATGNWNNWRTIRGAMMRKGTSTQRPTTFLTSNPGAQYYDTTLHKLLVWDGTQWRDTMGNVV